MKKIIFFEDTFLTKDDLLESFSINVLLVAVELNSEFVFRNGRIFVIN